MICQKFFAQSWTEYLVPILHSSKESQHSEITFSCFEYPANKLFYGEKIMDVKRINDQVENGRC